MGLFEHFPYTNFHELNLDWVINEMKKLSDRVEDLEQRIEGLKQEILDSVDVKLQEFKVMLLDELENKLNELKQELTLLIDTKITEAITHIITRIESLENRITQLDNKLTECCNEVKESIANINREIDSINTILDSVVGDITNIESNITNINNEISSIKNRLDDDEASIDSILGTIGSINTSIGAINKQISGLTNNVTSLGDRISTVENDISSLTTDVNDHEERITALERGGSSGGSDAIYNCSVSTLQQVNNNITLAKKRNYKSINISVESSGAMPENRFLTTQFIKNQANNNLVSIQIDSAADFSSHIIMNNNVARDFSMLFMNIDVQSRHIMNSYFEYCNITLKNVPTCLINGCIFIGGIIEINANASEAVKNVYVFSNCIFREVTINCNDKSGKIVFDSCNIKGSISEDIYVFGGFLSNCALSNAVFDNSNISMCSIIDNISIKNHTIASVDSGALVSKDGTSTLNVYRVN